MRENIVINEVGTRGTTRCHRIFFFELGHLHFIFDVIFPCRMMIKIIIIMKIVKVNYNHTLNIDT